MDTTFKWGWVACYLVACFAFGMLTRCMGLYWIAPVIVAALTGAALGATEVLEDA